MDDGWQYSSHGSFTFLAPHMQPETSNKAPNISKEYAAEEEGRSLPQSAGMWHMPAFVVSALCFHEVRKMSTYLPIKGQNMGLLMMWRRSILVLVQGCGKAYGQLEVWLSKDTT